MSNGPMLNMKKMWLILVLVLHVAPQVWSQGSIPTFVNISALNNRYLPEDFPLNGFLGTIQAKSYDGKPVTCAISGNGGEYFFCDSISCNVTLKKKLDYELIKEIRSTITISDGREINSVACATFINDVNDNAPQFTDTAIFRSLAENTIPPFVVTPISVTDVDTVNIQIRVTCAPETPAYQEACNTFNVQTVTSTNKYWYGNLVLVKPLDYETRIAYNIKLIAFDGKFNTSNEVHVEVIDVNDTPPKFLGNTVPKPVCEEQPIGTSIHTVTAVDGDLTNPRPIYYELFGNNAQLFQINSSTGVISNAMRLDYDNDQEHEKGVPYDISIRAREVIMDNGTMQLGNDSTNTATLTILVTVTDINDNGPTFSAPNYVAYVDENIVSGANIPGLQISVSDIDSGTFNSFNLRLLNSSDIFGIVPSSDASSSVATIFVRNGSAIDYESGITQYNITVEAEQNFNKGTADCDPPIVQNKTRSTALVTININDINDITPSFSVPFYNVTVIETASVGTIVATIVASDPEKGNFGKDGFIYKLFGDNTPPNFQIDQTTGVVTVAPCNNPGTAPCIDYERKKDYTLTVSVTDNKGLPGARSRSIQLFIYVLDVNDNWPLIDSSYTRYIYEDQQIPVNQLLIEPVDPDTVGGPLIFTIFGTSLELWTITKLDNNTASITAKRPIKYEDTPGSSGEFNFFVEVSDQIHNTTSPVKIIVIDINDNAPKFVPDPFNEYGRVFEAILGEQFVIRLTATDADAPTTGNGIIDFYILSGAQGKFTITNITQEGRNFVADVFSSKDARFDYDLQSSYNLQLQVRDRGSPQSLYGTGTLIVYVVDDNNRDPVIQPSFQSISVYENEPVGKSIYRVTATDPDANNSLIYYMRAREAISGIGETLNNTNDFINLFRIDMTTGDVYVNMTLERDKTSRITFDLRVVDVNAYPAQTGDGTLLIHILEYNDKPPYFDSIYNISIPEELNINSFVLNINCQDDNDKIAGYSITQEYPRLPIFFTLLPGSGALIVNSRIDYDQKPQVTTTVPLELIELTGRCTDTGEPALSNTTRITIHINNINDNSPVFLQNVYEASVPENTTNAPLNLTVTATDADIGDFGVLRYQLKDPYGYFAIDNITGQITLLPNVLLDREKVAFLPFQVVASDSPSDPLVRRSTTVPVFIYVLDINDNCPEFSKTFYEAKVPESASSNTDLIDIIATDADAGDNGKLAFSVNNNSWNPPETEQLFGIRSYTGRVFVQSALKGKIGTYRFNVTATDGGSPPCMREVPVQIEVQQSDNHAPEWIRPPIRNYIIYVLESQYKGMLVYEARANDTDPGLNGIVDYYFSVPNVGLVSSTAEFRINRVTGVIRAEVVFDREQEDTYFLILVARDQGNPAASSEITVIVRILDVNDNEPKFEVKDGVIQPMELNFNRNSQSVPVVLGRCNATDADLDVDNNRILYRLLASDEVSKYIVLDNTTCDITLVRQLQGRIDFNILAYNPKNDDTVRRSKREVNPSILPVSIYLRDTSNTAPVFSMPNYTACVSQDAPFKRNILQLEAVDREGDIITYSLTGTTDFSIDKSSGIIYSNISFRETASSKQIYQFKAMASDFLSSSSVDVTVLVTSPSNIARVQVNQPLSDVLPFRDQFAKMLRDTSNGALAFVCVADVTNHVGDDGLVSAAQTDVLLSALKMDGGQYAVYSSDDLVTYLNKKQAQNDPAFNVFYVTGVKEEKASSSSSLLKEDAVLAVLIISILLIFLVLLLLIIACLCLRHRDKKEKSAPPVYVSQTEPIETYENPAYDVGIPENVEYSTVKKVRPVATTVSPVISPDLTYGREPEIEPAEPPRMYYDEPEPVIVTELEPEPFSRNSPEPEPFIVTELEPEPSPRSSPEPVPFIVAELDPEPSPRHSPEPEPFIVTELEPEPVYRPVSESSWEIPQTDYDETSGLEPEFEHRREVGLGPARVSFNDPIPEDEDRYISPLPSPPSSITQEQPDYPSD